MRLINRALYTPALHGIDVDIVNVKRMRRFHAPQRLAQNGDVVSEGYYIARTSFSEIGGNEVGCTRNVCASILHGARLALMLGLMKLAQPTGSRVLRALPAFSFALLWVSVS